MAKRHEIQNLVRRGHVFYWRPRIPRHFARVGDSHLSLSLHQSCHMKAGYIARRLNTLLHEMKMKPTAAVTTKDQLETLFRAEAARMADHLDNLQFAGMRVGADPLLALRADLEVGWAYRLVELFGTLRRLDFKSGCPGRKVLEREGIPETSIAAIADIFAQEQAESRRAPFVKALRAEMTEHGIPDTLVNRERATAELMRARADMLLASPARYPEAEGLGVPEILWTEGSHSAEDETAAAPSAEVQPAPAPAPEPQPEPEPKSLPEPDPQPGVASAPSSSLAAPLPHGKPLAVSDLKAECEALIKSKRTWEKKTAQDMRVAVRAFAGILAEHGVSDVSEIEQFHVGRLRRYFDEIPARYGQSVRMRQLSPKQLREAAASMVAAAQEVKQPPPEVGLAVNTIRKHLGNLGEFLLYLRGQGFAVRELTFEGLRPAKLKATDIRTLTAKPGPDRLRPMFKLPVFTGCRDADNQALPGNQVYHSANYFVPMLLTYLGARRNEITGLAADDVVETENGWAIDIRINQFHRVKNVQSLRMLPVPDEVLRLGFVPYAQAIRDLGHKALFPELHHPDGGNDHGDRFYDDFKPLIDASDEVDTWERFLHALRHGHADTLKQRGVSPELINDISGRLNRSETSIRYTNVAGLPLIRVLLQKYPNVTEHLAPRPLQLLPWVANRQPAPWTTRTRVKRLEQARAVRSENARKKRGLA